MFSKALRKWLKFNFNFPNWESLKPEYVTPRFRAYCIHMYVKLVGAIGFEPTTYGTQNRRATRLRHAPTLVHHLEGNAGNEKRKMAIRRAKLHFLACSRYSGFLRPQTGPAGWLSHR